MKRSQVMFSTFRALQSALGLAAQNSSKLKLEFASKSCKANP